jgi:hypothetical protein
MDCSGGSTRRLADRRHRADRPVRGGRDWASRQLQKFQDRLDRYNRAIGIVLGLVVGIWFIVKGSRKLRDWLLAPTERSGRG